MLTFIREIIGQNQGILVVIGAAFAFYKWQVSQNQKEAAMIFEMLKVIRDNEGQTLVIRSM